MNMTSGRDLGGVAQESREQHCIRGEGCHVLQYELYLRFSNIF
jgi:hypothetical protein